MKKITSLLVCNENQSQSEDNNNIEKNLKDIIDNTLGFDKMSDLDEEEYYERLLDNKDEVVKKLKQYLGTLGY